MIVAAWSTYSRPIVARTAVQNPAIGCAVLSGGRRGMFAVEVYAAVHHIVFLEGQARREAAWIFGIATDWRR